MTSGVYQIRNMVTGRRYIGSAVNVASRWATHRALLRSGQHRNRKLLGSWGKHGEAAFDFSILLICAKRDLVDYEQRCIDGFDAVVGGYNVLPVAGSALGYRHTAEHRLSLSGNQHAKGLMHSPETRARLAEASRGNQHSLGAVHSPEVRLGRAAALRGVPKSAAHRAAIGAAHRGMKRSEAAKENMRAAWARRHAKSAA